MRSGPSLSHGKCFPNAASIRLVGIMEPVIANSALATIDPTEFVSHALEDFHDCGKARYGSVCVASAPGCGEAVLPKYRICHANYRHLTWPGNMIGLLDPLPGRCTSLGPWALGLTASM